MRDQTSRNVRAKLLCEYVDDVLPERPGGQKETPPQSANVRARLIGSFIDRADKVPESEFALRSFIVLTSDNRSITVRGHSIECGPESRQIVLYDGGRKLAVAVFEPARLVGIFEGTELPRDANGVPGQQ